MKWRLFEMTVNIFQVYHTTRNTNTYFDTETLPISPDSFDFCKIRTRVIKSCKSYITNKYFIA